MARLTRDEAEERAQQEANARSKDPAQRGKARAAAAVDVYEHIGGTNPAGYVPATGRFMTRPAGKPAPRWNVWQKVATKEPQA